jgi:OHCU decarboxylase
MELPTELARNSPQEFLKAFQNLYEHSPWVVEQSLDLVATDDKYNNLESFHQLLSEIMLHSDNDLQDNLIVGHPTLAGKKAQNNQLTDFSTAEQKSAGLSDCTDSEISLFEKFNEEYFSKFKFPFIIAVKEKNKADIIASFKERIGNSMLDERSNALNEINKVVWLRIKQIYGL